MAEIEVWQALAAELEAGRPVALLAVVASQGSSPGRPGALMAVGPDGPLAGTLGGGRGEETAAALAAGALRRGAPVPVLLTQTHRPDADAPSGMICGGEQRIALAPCRQDQLPALRALIDALAAGDRISWTLSPDGWRAEPSPRPGLVETDGTWRYAAVSGPSHGVYLIGGGHVSLALSRVLAPLDFRITVVEERPGVATWQQNRFAHEKLACAYEDLGAVVPAGRQTFAAIMTHAPERDAAALRALVGKPLGYLGLLGSRSKIRHLLAGRQMPPHFHAPMGLPIDSHTPDEIAVSIAAEMLARRNGGG